jgi:hypothetical protein
MTHSETVLTVLYAAQYHYLTNIIMKYIFKISMKSVYIKPRTDRAIVEKPTAAKLIK